MSFSGILLTLIFILLIIVVVMCVFLWAALTGDKPSFIKDRLLGDKEDNYKDYFYRTPKDRNKGK